MSNSESPSMKTKYLVVPGRIATPHNHKSAYLTAHQLIHLYAVSPAECLIASDLESGIYLRELYPHLILLRPRYNGKYDIPAPVPGKTVS